MHFPPIGVTGEIKPLHSEHLESWMTPPEEVANGRFFRGCVKTFSCQLDRLSRNKNRVPTQISGLLTDPSALHFK